MSTIVIKTTTTLQFDAGDVSPHMIAAGIKKEGDGFSVLGDFTTSDLGGSQKTEVDSVEVVDA
jgi:hypothetical protein